jgi:hypothetical protein
MGTPRGPTEGAWGPMGASKIIIMASKLSIMASTSKLSMVASKIGIMARKICIMANNIWLETLPKMFSIEVTMISIDLARGNLRFVVVHVRVYSVPTAFLLEFAMPTLRVQELA